MRGGAGRRGGPPLLPWPVRGVAAGAGGTLAMTLAYYIERKLRGGSSRRVQHLRDGTRVPGLATHSGLDFDDTIVPGQIVASILHLPSVTNTQAGELAIALRWSYGCAFGITHVLLRARLPEPGASVVFGSILLTMTFTMFPLLGRTPPPWRWRPDVLATAIGTHATYVVAAAMVDDLLRHGVRSSESSSQAV